jgi:hypothetical protein
MKTIIVSALGILVLSAPLASAQQRKRSWTEKELTEWAVRDRQRKEAERRAFERSPEGIRQELARLREMQEEIIRQQNNDRFDAKRERNWQQTQREVEAANQRHRARVNADNR